MNDTVNSDAIGQATDNDALSLQHFQTLVEVRKESLQHAVGHLESVFHSSTGAIYHTVENVLAEAKKFENYILGI